MQIYLLLPSVSAKAILKMLSRFLNDVQVCMGGNFGNQNLARTATSGARSASSQLTDKSPKQSAQPKAQVCWFARLLTKVLRQHRAHSHPKDACLLLSDPLGTAPATPGG